ncbi:MAG: Crp/Fnr family transcriptional regulator [Saprospiraceae bacterium]|nr:Crp/Fnr family transcriptional regulator [Saprospiraceae bacterium]
MDLDNGIAQIRNAEPWNALPEAAWSKLRKSARLISVSKHQVLFHQSEHGQGVFIVTRGLMKLSKAIPQGKDTSIFLAQPGDTIGEQLLGVGTCYACRAQALVDSTLVEINAEWVVQAAQQYPAFGWSWCRFLLERLRESEERLLRHRFNLTRQRIGLFLKEVARHHARSLVNGEIELELPMTHELLGEMVSVSRQRVTTVLGEWAEAGIIRYARNRIVLTKPELLC